MARLYNAAHRLALAAQDEPVRLRGWAAVAATLALQAIILASQGLEPWAIAGTLATLALPLLGLEAARARVSPVDPSPDPPPPPRPPRGPAGNVRLPRPDQDDPGGRDLYERWQDAVRPLVEAARQVDPDGGHPHPDDHTADGMAQAIRAADLARREFVGGMVRSIRGATRDGPAEAGGSV